MVSLYTDGAGNSSRYSYTFNYKLVYLTTNKIGKMLVIKDCLINQKGNLVNQ